MNADALCAYVGAAAAGLGFDLTESAREAVAFNLGVLLEQAALVMRFPLRAPDDAEVFLP